MRLASLTGSLLVCISAPVGAAGMGQSSSATVFISAIVPPRVIVTDRSGNTGAAEQDGAQVCLQGKPGEFSATMQQESGPTLVLTPSSSRDLICNTISDQGTSPVMMLVRPE